jgi:hypothetical protein
VYQPRLDLGPVQLGCLPRPERCAGVSQCPPRAAFTWLFNNAIGSVLIVMLFHNMNNAFSGVFVGQMFSGQDSVNQSWLRLALWGVVAIILIVGYGPHHLSRKHQKQEIAIFQNSGLTE